MPIFLIGTLAQKHHLQHEDGPLVDATNYRNVVGAQQYLTLTRPNLTHAVNLICQFMNCPGVSHFQVMKHILHCLENSQYYNCSNAILATKLLKYKPQQRRYS